MKAAQVPKKKINIVKELSDLIKNKKTILIASIKNLPASQFQEIGKKLRGNVIIKVPKKNLIFRAIDESKNEKAEQIKKQIKETFEYDVYDWSKNGYGDLKKLKNKKEYKFYLPEKQRNTLNLQLKQYKSKNLNLALRNMTVYTDLRQFFYSIKEEITV